MKNKREEVIYTKVLITAGTNATVTIHILSEPFVFLRHVVFLVPDVTITWYCDIYHHGILPLLAHHHYYVQLVGWSVCVYLKVL